MPWMLVRTSTCFVSKTELVRIQSKALKFNASHAEKVRHRTCNAKQTRGGTGVGLQMAKKKLCEHYCDEKFSVEMQCSTEPYCCEYGELDGHGCSRSHEFVLVVSCIVCNKEFRRHAATDIDSFLSTIVKECS